MWRRERVLYSLNLILPHLWNMYLGAVTFRNVSSVMQLISPLSPTPFPDCSAPSPFSWAFEPYWVFFCYCLFYSCSPPPWGETTRLQMVLIGGGTSFLQLLLRLWQSLLLEQGLLCGKCSEHISQWFLLPTPSQNCKGIFFRYSSWKSG